MPRSSHKTRPHRSVRSHILRTRGETCLYTPTGSRRLSPTWNLATFVQYTEAAPSPLLHRYCPYLIPSQRIFVALCIYSELVTYATYVDRKKRSVDGSLFSKEVQGIASRQHKPEVRQLESLQLFAEVRYWLDSPPLPPASSCLLAPCSEKIVDNIYTTQYICYVYVYI